MHQNVAFMKSLLLIFLGGGTGSVLRYLLTISIYRQGATNYKPQNKMFHFCKTFCSKITLVNTIQNVILNPI